MCTYAQSSHVSKATFACSRYLERLIATFQTISAHLRLMLFSFKSPRNRPSPNAHVSAPPLSLLVSHSHPRTDIMGLAASERDGTQASLVGVLLLFGLSLGVVFTCRTIHTISASHKRAHTLSLARVPSFRTRIEIASPMVSRRGVGSSFEVPTSNVVARQAKPNLMIPLAHSFVRYVLTPVHRTGHIEQEHRLLASLSSVCDTNPSSVVGR